MTTDADLDRILKTWLSDVTLDRVPPNVLRSALSEVETTGQRRSVLGWLARLRPSRAGGLATPRELGMGFVLLIALVAAVGVGVGAAVVLRGEPDPTRGPSVAPSGAPSPSAPGEVSVDGNLRNVRFEELGVSAGIPAGWTEATQPTCCEIVAFAAPDESASLSIGHGNPFSVAFCAPDCRTIVIPERVPYSTAVALDFVASEIGRHLPERVGDTLTWNAVGDDLIADLTQARRADVSVAAGDGRLARHTYLIGMHRERPVVIAWTQPEPGAVPGLFDRVVAGFRFLSGGPTYSYGALATFADPRAVYTIAIPDSWPLQQVAIAGVAVPGLSQFGDGQLTIGTSGTDGRIGLCDPTCRELDGLRTVDDLVTALKSNGAVAASPAAMTLGGEPARHLVSAPGTSRSLEHVVAEHDGRLTVVTFDHTSGSVERSAVEQMLISFLFLDPADPTAPDRIVAAPDGSFSIGLADDWRTSVGLDASAIYATRGPVRLAIYAGDASGMIRRCDRAAGAWEECHPVRVSSLDELVAAASVKPIADHGVGPPVGVRDSAMLDGESAVLVRIQAYEYPARSGQALVQVMAFHDGRPFLMRIWTSQNNLVGDADLIRAFKFHP